MLSVLKIHDKKLLKIVVLVALPIAAFVAGFYINEQINAKRIKSLSNDLSQTRTDLEFANKDIPKVLESKTSVYPVKGLPIHSSLFEGKEIEVNELSFKGKIIKEFIVFMDKKETVFPTKVIVWDYQSDNSDRFNHTYLVNKFRIHKGIEYITPDNKNVYNAKSGFAWNKEEQKLSILYEITSNHAIFVEIEDTNVIIGNTYWDGSVPQDLQLIADSIGF